MIKECYQKSTSLYFFKDLCFWKFHISWRLISKNLSKIFNLPTFLCRKLVFENFILATGYVENWCHLHCQSNLIIVLKLLLYRCLLLVLVYQVLNLISPVLIHSSIIIRSDWWNFCNTKKTLDFLKIWWFTVISAIFEQLFLRDFKTFQKLMKPLYVSDLNGNSNSVFELMIWNLSFSWNAAKI